MTSEDPYIVEIKQLAEQQNNR